MDIRVSELQDVIEEARAEAYKATCDYIAQHGDGYPCGFAWVNISKFDGKRITGNTRIGRALKAAGIEQNYSRQFQIWNPSGHMTQNVDAKYAGAIAAANVFKRYGFEAYPGERLD